MIRKQAREVSWGDWDLPELDRKGENKPDTEEGGEHPPGEGHSMCKGPEEGEQGLE